MSAIQPISPAKARKAKVTVIPVYVIQSVNELIVKNLRNGTATFRQDELISLIASKEGENAADELCRKGYLESWGGMWFTTNPATTRITPRLSSSQRKTKSHECSQLLQLSSLFPPRQIRLLPQRTTNRNHVARGQVYSPQAFDPKSRAG